MVYTLGRSVTLMNLAICVICAYTACIVVRHRNVADFLTCIIYRKHYPWSYHRYTIIISHQSSYLLYRILSSISTSLSHRHGSRENKNKLTLFITNDFLSSGTRSDLSSVCRYIELVVLFPVFCLKLPLKGSYICTRHTFKFVKSFVGRNRINERCDDNDMAP